MFLWQQSKSMNTFTVCWLFIVVFLYRDSVFVHNCVWCLCCFYFPENWWEAKIHIHPLKAPSRVHTVVSHLVVCSSKGHIVGPVLCHSFCNSQGLPDIGSGLSRPQRSAVLICYLTGVLLFLVMLFPFTDPFLYGARPVCSLAASQALECWLRKCQILKKVMKNKILRQILTLVLFLSVMIGTFLKCVHDFCGWTRQEKDPSASDISCMVQKYFLLYET